MSPLRAIYLALAVWGAVHPMYWFVIYTLVLYAVYMATRRSRFVSCFLFMVLFGSVVVIYRAKYERLNIEQDDEEELLDDNNPFNPSAPGQGALT